MQEAYFCLELRSEVEHNYIALLVLFEIRTAVLLKVQILWDVTHSRLSNILSHFLRTLCAAEKAAVKLDGANKI